MRQDDICRSCADCGVTRCNKDAGAWPDFCLTTHMDKTLLSQALAEYDQGDNHRIMSAAALVEYEGYCRLTRVEEIMDFARRMGYRKLGIATCVGLIRESRTAAKIFRAGGFAVYGAACKAGAVDKTQVGIDPACRAVGANMCNPIAQARLLNAANTDLNVVIGLCVGHDSLFYRYSAAPATTLVTKDRVLGHNPAAALYTADSYYKRLTEPAQEP